MLNKVPVQVFQIKAFTMLESLLVLGLVSILALGLSGSVSPLCSSGRRIFFMEFEELYQSKTQCSQSTKD